MGSAGPEQDGNTFYFRNWEDIESLFAGNALPNLKRAGERLHAVFTARDTWIRITAETQEALDRALSFMHNLIQASKTCGTKLESCNFEQILSASAGNTDDAGIQSYYTGRITVSPGKKPVIPRSANQLSYIRAIREHDIVFGVGPAGTGKTYLAMAMAVSALLKGECDRIILTRPAVEAGENLGYLPGNLEEKINPFLRPLYDALYDMMEISQAEELTARNVLEVAPLAFMRGRTLNHAFVILDEAQNTTREQMLMFLTRLGFHSKCVVCGDPTQTDLPRHKESGLGHALEKLKHINEIKICTFGTLDVVRHSLVEKIIRAYEEEDYGKDKEITE